MANVCYQEMNIGRETVEIALIIIIIAKKKTYQIVKSPKYEAFCVRKLLIWP